MYMLTILHVHVRVGLLSTTVICMHTALLLFLVLLLYCVYVLYMIVHVLAFDILSRFQSGAAYVCIWSRDTHDSHCWYGPRPETCSQSSQTGICSPTCALSRKQECESIHMYIHVQYTFSTVYLHMQVLCIHCIIIWKLYWSRETVMWVRIPPGAAHFFFEKKRK